MEIAQEENLPIGLVQEMVLEVEREGEICRDESDSGVAIFATSSSSTGAGVGWAASGGGGEVRWWVNIFRGYVWDGQE